MDYGQSETKHEQCRLTYYLFEILRQSDKYPYNRPSYLKRRVNTRNGESAGIKLARDIHVILLVIDGDDFEMLSEVISIGKPGRGRKSTNITSTEEKCQCKLEIQFMKDTIASLQAELLLIKQRQATTENIRNAENKNLTRGMDVLKMTSRRLKTNLLRTLQI